MIFLIDYSLLREVLRYLTALRKKEVLQRFEGILVIVTGGV